MKVIIKIGGTPKSHWTRISGSRFGVLGQNIDGVFTPVPVNPKDIRGRKQPTFFAKEKNGYIPFLQDAEWKNRELDSIIILYAKVQEKIIEETYSSKHNKLSYTKIKIEYVDTLKGEYEINRTILESRSNPNYEESKKKFYPNSDSYHGWDFD